MVRPDIADYISRSLDRGYTKEQIKRALLNSGWTHQEIDEAINHVTSKQAPSSVLQKKKNVRPKKSSKIPIALIIILIIGGGIALWFLVINPIIYSLMIFNPGSYTARISTGFAGLGAPDDWDLSSNGDFVMILRNRQTNEIDLERIDITLGSASDSYEPATPVTIGPGYNHAFTSSETGLNLGPRTGTYSVDVTVTYKSSSGFTHSETGTVSGTVS